jgi:hypothetical protein
VRLRALLVAWSALAASGCGLLPQCTTRALSIDEVCGLDGGTLAANTTLTVQVRESCGSACGMGTSFSCAGTLDGGVITFAPTISECSDPMTACPAVCRQSAVDCSVPALAPGTYTLSGPGVAAKQLVVDATSSATRCAF